MKIHTKTNNFQQYHEIWMTYLQMINSFFLNILKYTVNGIQQHPELYETGSKFKSNLFKAHQDFTMCKTRFMCLNSIVMVIIEQERRKKLSLWTRETIIKNIYNHQSLHSVVKDCNHIDIQMKGVTNALSRAMGVYKNMHTFLVIQSNFKSTSTCVFSTKIEMLHQIFFT